MGLQTGHSYEFGPFRLEPAERRLLRNGEDVPLSPKAFELLVVLVSRAGHLVPKEELLRDVWAGTFVEEANLSYTVSLLRRALQTGSADERYIDTVQKLGYRFTGAVQTASSDGVALQPTVAPPAAPGIRNPRRRLAAAVGVTVLVLGLAAILLFRVNRHGEPSPVLSRFDVTLPAHITLTRFDQPVISPDGRRVAFSGVSNGTRQLFVRPLAGPTVLALPDTEGAMLPFWSPDSKRLAFYSDRKLKTIDADGGPSTLLCAGLRSPNVFWGAWRSGVILFSSGPVYRIAEGGGKPEAITRVEPSESAHFIRSFLSDGRRFLFMDMQVPRNVYVGSLDDPNEKRPLNIGSTASPVRDVIAFRGHLIYAQKGAVVAQAFDEDSLELRGAPLRLAETDGTPWQPRASVSQTGTLVFRSTGDAIKQLTWRGRDGRLLGVVGRPALDTQIELSPTDTRAILVRGGPWPEDRDLWLADLTTNNVSILTARPGLDSDPAWSPDEGRIAYSSSQDGMVSPVVKNLDTGNEERLIKTSERVVVDDWTGDSLVVRSGDVFTLPVEGERKLRPLAVTPYSRDQLQVSSDGRSIAFNADESDVWEVYVARFMKDFPGKRKVSQNGGIQPRWRRDGRELFYLAPDGTMMVVERAGDETLEFGAARPLFKTPLNAADPAWSEYDVTSDGQRFLILEPTAAAPPVFTFILNWSHGQK